MAFVLKLSDGTNTIDFMSDNYLLEDGGLQISNPEQLESWTDPTTQLGPRLVDHREGNRTIAIKFQIAGHTRQIIRDGINTISEMLKDAIEYNLGKGTTRVGLLYGWDTVTTAEYFEVMSGTLQMPDDVMSVGQMHGMVGGNYAVRGCVLNLIVSPNAYGVDPGNGSLLELPLSNRNGTRITGGLLIGAYTHPASTTEGQGVHNTETFWHDSFVEIAGSDIAGDLLARVRIEVQDDTSSAAYKLIMGVAEKITLPKGLILHCKDTGFSTTLTGTTFVPNANLPGSYFLHYSGVLPNGSGPFLSYRLTSTASYKARKYRVIWVSGGAGLLTNWPVKLQVRSAVN